MAAQTLDEATPPGPVDAAPGHGPPAPAGPHPDRRTGTATLPSVTEGR